MKPQIRIIDDQFAHSNGGSFGTGDLNIRPTCFDWHRGERISDLVVITENSFYRLNEIKEPIKIALILEPKCINSHVYSWMRSNYHLFTHVLSHNEELLSQIPNGQYYFFGGCWIEPKAQKVYLKSKGVSIIASDKKQAPGHILRHEVIGTYGEWIDASFGRGYNPIHNKITALQDYHYSIVIENEQSDAFATEKIIDCFATGTIPIYWGTDKIREYFDEEGILFFNTLEELEACLKIATPEYYRSRMRAVQKNFEFCKQFQIPEDLIYKTFLEKKYFK